jgi:molybdate transport system substrate-binding protein
LVAQGPSSSKNRDLAQRFIDFILSEEGRAIFQKYHYLMTPDEAFAYIGEKKPVGGEYAVFYNTEHISQCRR